MPTGTSSAWKQLQETWARLSPQGRRAVLAAGVATFAGLMIWTALSTRSPSFVPLFTRLNAQDASAIMSKLQSQKVPYRLASQGTTIEVPQSQVYRLRIEMASQGLPSRGVVGFSIVNSLGIGSTPFQQRVAYLRALQGELTRTIEDIYGVRSARVHIVLPQQSAFLVSQTPPSSAAVLVRMKPGYTLSATEVRGITHLLASSVQGLKPSAVTIVNGHGQLVSLPAGGSQAAAVGAASNNMQLQLAFDKNLQDSLVSLLTPVFGPGNVVAHVQAALNFNQQTVTQNLFKPAAKGNGLLRSMQQLQETFKGKGLPPGGVPGTTSNIPTYPAITAAAGPTSYTKTQTTQNFEIDQTQQRTVVAPGTVKHMSVAVIINHTLTGAQQKLVLRTVQAAIGVVPSATNQIQVVGMPFNTSLAAALARKPRTAPKGFSKLTVYEAAGGAALLILVLLALLLRRRGGKAAEQREAQLAQELLADAQPATQAPADESADLVDLLRRRPEDTANIVRAWLSEEE